MQPSQAKRQPTLSPAEAEEMRQAFLDGVVVTEVFANEVPHVRGEHIVPLRGPALELTLAIQEAKQGNDAFYTERVE